MVCMLRRSAIDSIETNPSSRVVYAPDLRLPPVQSGAQSYIGKLQYQGLCRLSQKIRLLASSPAAWNLACCASVKAAATSASMARRLPCWRQKSSAQKRPWWCPPWSCADAEAWSCRPAQNSAYGPERRPGAPGAARGVGAIIAGWPQSHKSVTPQIHRGTLCTPPITSPPVRLRTS